jgi:ribokinase
MDLTAKTVTAPLPGETVVGTSFTMVPGGKGNNQAVTCARQGVPTSIIGRLGEDRFGDEIRAQLLAEEVDVSHLAIDRGSPTGIAHIRLDATGENSIVVVPGANSTLGVDDIARATGLIEEASVLLVQLEVPLVTVEAALEIARCAGTITLLNPAPAQELSDELLAKVDICVPNELEAAALTQLEVDGPASAAWAAARLRSRGCGSVVVTLGSKGAVYLDSERTLHLAALEVPVVDTVAAGDAFCGALASALANRSPIDAALARASATSALAVGVAGATSSLPPAEAVDELLARMDGPGAGHAHGAGDRESGFGPDVVASLREHRHRFAH